MSGLLGRTEENPLRPTPHRLILFLILKIHALTEVTVNSKLFLNVTLYGLVTKLQLF